MACKREITSLRLSGAGYALDVRPPCTVLQALSGAGAVEGLEEGLRAREAEWAALRAWTFSGVADVRDVADERVYLCFETLRGTGVLRVGGREIAFSDGPLRADVTGEAFGREEMPFELAFDPAPPVGVPPRAAQGVLGRVRLVGVSAARIERMALRAQADELVAEVAVEAFVPGRYTLRYALTAGDEILGVFSFEETLPAARVTLLHAMRPGDVSWPLWRPGRNNAPVSARLQLLRRNMACDSLRMRTGFRTVQSELYLPGQPAMLCGVNGEPMHLLCARHEPDVHAAAARADFDALVRLAREAGLNALFVCGEEAEAFYDACDEAGLMIFQRLPRGREEETAARLCARPCIVQWAAQDVPAAQAALARLGDVRPLALPAQPGLPGAGATACLMRGPELPGSLEDMARGFAQDTAPMREAPVRAAVSGVRLQELAAGAPCWPETGPFWMLRGGGSVIDREMLREACGEAPAEDMRALCALSRCLQAEALRRAALSARMRGASAVLGSLRESFPAPCSDALVEADGARRPAYFAVREALAPLCAAICLDRLACWPGTHLDGFIHLLCREQMQDVAVHAALYDASGAVLWQEARIVQEKSQQVLRAYAQLPETPGLLLLRVCVLRGAQEVARSEQIVCVGAPGPMWPLLHPAPAALRAQDGRVRNDGAFAAFGVLTGEGWFNLLPGEDASCPDGRFECLNG